MKLGVNSSGKVLSVAPVPTICYYHPITQTYNSLADEEKPKSVSKYLSTGGIYCLYKTKFDDDDRDAVLSKLGIKNKDEDENKDDGGDKKTTSKTLPQALTIQTNDFVQVFHLCRKENKEKKPKNQCLMQLSKTQKEKNDEKKAENDHENIKVEKIAYSNGSIGLCGDGVDCPIYLKMAFGNEYNKENLMHIQNYNHFNNNYFFQTECKYKNECKIHRLGRSGRQLSIEDKCHLAIYRHPPRVDRSLILQENMNPVTLARKPVHSAAYESGNSVFYYGNPVHKLIFEIAGNGFVKDLFVKKSNYKDNEKKDNNGNNGNNHNNNNRNGDELVSILTIVNEKLECDMHKNKFGYCLHRHEMLSLLLYTDLESPPGKDQTCNYDLSDSQRRGNFTKWKIFDWCLNNAIDKLSQRENYQLYNNGNGIPLYNGISGCRMNKKSQFCYFMPTFVSTSYNKEVAKAFARRKGDGMLIELDCNLIKTFKCCCVEWISRFGSAECEILVARTPYFEPTIMTVQGIENDLQIVQLSRFKDKYPHIELFTGSGICTMKEVFIYLFTNKNDLIKIDSLNKDYTDGIEVLYNDVIFKEYKKKYESEIGYVGNILGIDWSTHDDLITMEDLIKMQQNSQILCNMCESGAYTAIHDICKQKYGRGKKKEENEMQASIMRVKNFFVILKATFGDE